MQIQVVYVIITFICICIIIPIHGRTLSSQIYPIATTTPRNKLQYSLSRYERGLEDYDDEQRSLSEARGIMTMEEDMQANKAIKNDPWQGYYDFLINEGSFKFWAVFQVVTAIILIYSAFAAVYYAKYNFIQTDYDYADYFLGRSDMGPSNDAWFGLSSQTFQRIFDAISSNKYS